MASPNVKTFTQLIQGFAAAVQAAASGLVDFTAGSLELAFGEATASVALWLQGLILVLLQTTRAATSQGADLDSWVADYGLTRLPPGFAVGAVTFSRFNASGQGLVQVGATVQTADGTQQYVVTADPANAAYSATLGGYVLANTIGSVSVPVQATFAGAAGNAVTGAVSVITAAIPGIDTVTNAAGFAGGSDAEADTALRSRFISYLGSLSKATPKAVGFAILSVQQGVSYTLTENFTYAAVAQQGHFSIVVDDGSGAPGAPFLTSVYNAVDLVRPVGSTFEVHGPTVETANLVAVLTVASGYVKATVAAAVSAALRAYVNGLGLGNGLNYSRLAQIAYDTSPGVTNVTGVTVNGGTADLAATAVQTIKVGTCTVTAP